MKDRSVTHDTIAAITADGKAYWVEETRTIITTRDSRGEIHKHVEFEWRCPDTHHFPVATITWSSINVDPDKPTASMSTPTKQPDGWAVAAAVAEQVEKALTEIIDLNENMTA